MECTNKKGQESGAQLLGRLREGKKLSFRQQMMLIIQLSIPAILAQISSIAMQYIDASMVGSLGAEASASIGLVSSSTWLLSGLCMAASIGFTVQVAHRIGAGEEKEARNIVRLGLIAVTVFSFILLIICVAISGSLPGWLGGEKTIQRDASLYFLIYGMSLPALQLNNLAGGMIQCSGNMKLPSTLHILMCGLDVVFNSILIFPSRTCKVFGKEIFLPGVGLGVAGAALGTALALLVTACLMIYFLMFRSETLRFQRNERMHFSKEELKKAIKLALPVGIEQIIMCGAQITSTKIVAPLGTIAIAANSFSVTAEGLCYMPGSGIGTAATTLIGQSIGARRTDLTRRLGYLTTILGIGVMTLSGLLMYVGAPFMIGLLSPDAQIRELGAEILRIEAFAEPMFGASIVASGVFRGAGDTMAPSCINFVSMWFIRIPLSMLLAGRYGLAGVWFAMATELVVRGILFLIRLKGKKWMKEIKG